LPGGIAINSSTGVVSGTLNATSSGSYNTVITVSDGTLTDTDSFSWTVTNINQPPAFSTNFGDRTDAEGAVINFDANASDPDGTTLTYSATGLPGGIAINSSTGVVSGTLNATSSGSYNTVITVSDGTLTDTDSFSWTVTEPATTVVYVDDTFTRTVNNGWGSATPTGGAYSHHRHGGQLRRRCRRRHDDPAQRRCHPLGRARWQRQRQRCRHQPALPD
jgi:hypothetical protein